MISSAPGNAEKRILAARFVDGPHVSAPDKAEQRLNDWLAELEPAQSAAIDQLTDHPHAKHILLGIAEFSPYLFDLMRADAARLKRLLACDPESHLEALIEKTSREMLVASGETDVMHLLRRMKAEAALLIALCDIGGVEIIHVAARLPGLRARDHQQGVEGANQPVGFLNGPFKRGAVLGLAAGTGQCLLGAVAQPRQRCLEVMGDVVGNLLQAHHQRLDALEHGVEVFREAIEFVTAAPDRQPA